MTSSYVKANDTTKNNTSLSNKEYSSYVSGLKQAGLYENKDGTIGGVFNMVDGTTIRVTGLDEQAGLIGAVKQPNGEYILKRFSYKEMVKFIERNGG